jgi:NAD-dependent dihydropyrimidine dehydrogenase PreA subunit
MKKSAVIKSDDCVGCGGCVDICSDVFGFDE